MSTLEEIENAVVHLSEDNLARFRQWFADFDAEYWDEQLKRDVEAGRLDALADQAIRDFQAGKCTEL